MFWGVFEVVWGVLGWFGVIRWTPFWVFLSPNSGILSLVRVTQITQFENGFLSL